MKKIETIAEYQLLASRTCPDLGSEEKNLLHMNLGITTEIGEFLDPIKKNIAYGKTLDVVNLGEELADIAWYVANKARLFFPLSLEETCKIEKYSLESTVKDYRENILPAFSMFDIEFKSTLIMLAITPDEDDYDIDFLSRNFSGVKDLVILKELAEDYGLDFFQILTNNIAKLQVRYPEKFTNEAALNRDLDAERVELEKGEFLGTSEAEVTL